MDDHAARGEVLEWLEQFADCVRRRDFAGAEPLFNARVVAFGTRNEVLENLSELRERQWRPTWQTTRDFRFLADTVHVELSATGADAWATALWTSIGEPGDRPAFDRRGRATFILRRAGGRWQCIHSHLSLMPVGLS